MDAHEALAEAEAEMTQAFQQLKQQIVHVNALKDALKRSHRCWPSRLSWGVAVCLGIYIVFMHSFWSGERQTWEARAIAQLEDSTQRLAKQQILEVEAAMQQFHQFQEEASLFLSVLSNHPIPVDWWKQKLNKKRAER